MTVEQRTWQLGLRLETAENPQGADGGAASHLRDAATRAAPKSKHKEKKVTSATMEEVTRRLALAFQKVASNQGAPGPDRQSIDEVRRHLDDVLSELATALLSGTYEPGDIRRVWIPKSSGGQRGLGIPNVARPEERHFLGFRLRCEPMDGTVEVLLSKRSKDRLDARVVELTPRTWGSTLQACIAGLNVYLRGWLGFFGICTEGIEGKLSNLDAHIRRRLRAIQIRHWKTKRTIARKLLALGVSRKLAWSTPYAGRRSTWDLSRTPAIHRALRNAYFAERGLYSLVDQYRRRSRYFAAPVQLRLALG
jgi:hypothetical protein